MKKTIHTLCRKCSAGSGSGGGAAQHSALGVPNATVSWAQILDGLPDLEIKWNEPLAPYTTFRIGGPVSCMIWPLNETALVRLMSKIWQHQIPYIILGGGSNVLVPDEPWDAVVVHLKRCEGRIERIEVRGDDILVQVGAGVRIARWVRHCIKMGWGGTEYLTGIPGTIGGAVVMNAGTRMGTIGETLVWVDVLTPKDGFRRLLRSELVPQYRSMGLPSNGVVTKACFSVRSCPGSVLRSGMRSIMRERRLRQPTGTRSAGCVFKNPPNISAGELIERAGLKGFRIGDAEISEKHANWIINSGKAKAKDILALIEHVEDRVQRQFGIRLHREVKVIGTMNSVNKL